MLACSTVNATSPEFAILWPQGDVENRLGGRTPPVGLKDRSPMKLMWRLWKVSSPQKRSRSTTRTGSSIRANKQPNCGIDLAIRVQTVVSLAEMSDRLKVACLFDEKTRKVTTGDGKRNQTDHLRHTLPLS
jgi:hypothetical protein